MSSRLGVRVRGTLADIDPAWIRSRLREPEVWLRRVPFKRVSLMLPRTDRSYIALLMRGGHS